MQHVALTAAPTDRPTKKPAFECTKKHRNAGKYTRQDSKQSGISKENDQNPRSEFSNSFQLEVLQSDERLSRLVDAWPDLSENARVKITRLANVKT